MELTEYVYESYRNQEIDESEMNYLFSVSENVIGDYLIRIPDFKRRYHYNKEDSTIIVDGEKYKVDFNIRNHKVTMSDSNKTDDKTIDKSSNENQKHEEKRALSVITRDGEDVIVLDKKLFKVKGYLNREAGIQHEIGHLKMNKWTSNHMDPRMINREVYEREYISAEADEEKRKLISKYIEKYNVKSYKELPINAKKEINFKINKFKVRLKEKLKRKPIKEIEDIMSKQQATKDEIEDRNHIRKTAEKWEKKTDEEFRKKRRETGNPKIRTSHNRPSEFEADQYSKNRTSEEAFRSMLYQYDKLGEKSSEILKEEIRKYMEKNDIKTVPSLLRHIAVNDRSKLNIPAIMKLVKEKKQTKETNNRLYEKMRFDALKDEEFKKSKLLNSYNKSKDNSDNKPVKESTFLTPEESAFIKRI